LQIPILSGVYTNDKADFRASYPVLIDFGNLIRYASFFIGKRKMKRTDLTPQELQRRLDYNPETGNFIWLPVKRENFTSDRIHKSWNSRYAGKRAGTPFQGYVMISINKRHFLAHRLAWFHFYGFWPQADIDHINGDRSDNRISNLRDVTRLENRRNSSMHGRNKSGTSGVDWFKPASLWRARIYDAGKEVNIGYFKSKEEAVAARLAAQPQYKYHENHGRQTSGKR
jgi:hypothetical protein